MLQQLEKAEIVRRMVAPHTKQKHKAALGQFMTPSSVARVMASMFPASSIQTCRLLDAGAGVGALSCAFLDRWVTGGFGFKTVDATAYEIDDTLHGHLARHLAGYQGVTARIISDDFIEQVTANDLSAVRSPKGYTHAILNPPYKKINSQSAHRLARRRVGIETVNLYSAFVALAVALAHPVTRSWQSSRAAFAMVRTTDLSVTSSWNGLPSIKCTCLSRAARHSRMTRYYKRISSSAWSVAGNKDR